MQNLQRILHALRHEPVDRVPVTVFLTSVTVELMEHSGYGWDQAHYNVDRLVELAAAHNYLGLETLKLPFDMTVEAEALGGKIDTGTCDTLPQLVTHLYKEPEELTFDRDLLCKGRIPVVLKAIATAKKRYDGEAAVVSSMECLTRLCIMYAGEQAAAGCDAVLIGEAASSGDLISSETDVAKACEILKGKTALVGYVDTMITLLHGTPEDVYKSAKECIHAGVDLLCAGPAHIPTENVVAMIQAAKSKI